MGFSEIIMMMIVYGGLFLYTSQYVSSNRKIMIYIKSVSLILLYSFISVIIWFTYKAEEHHINSHSGYAPISFTNEAIVMIIGLSIYSIVLLVLGIFLKRNRCSKS